MKRIGTACLGFGIFLCLGARVYAQPTFDLGFSGPDVLRGGAGATVSADYEVTLTPGGELDGQGAQGWSISITGDNVTFTGITTDGTIGANVPDGLRSNGFEKSELAGADRSEDDCVGRAGAVSAVVLSFTEAITAPVDSTSTIAIISIETMIGGDAAALEFADGCRGAGQPVENNVTWKGNTVKPVLGTKAIALEESMECPPAEGSSGVWTIIQTQNVGTSSDINAGIAPSPNGGSEPAEVELPPGEGNVYIGVVSNLDGGGVQGWSLAFGVDGDIDLVGATTDGTAGANVPDGLRSNGFEKTEVVDPALNNQGQGAVTAVVLSFTEAITLDPQGTATVACLTLAGEEGETGSISAKSGLRGAGQPVDNVATIGGGTAQYVCQQSANVTIVVPAGSFYRPGNANGDARLDIADPIWIINELFRDGPAATCQAANDANGDGLIDLSDATFLLNYFFFSGPMPSALDCIQLDEGSALTCEVSQDACS